MSDVYELLSEAQELLYDNPVADSWRQRTNAALAQRPVPAPAFDSTHEPPYYKSDGGPAALIAGKDAMSKALLAEYSREDLAKFLSSMQAACESLEGTIKELRAKIAEQAAEIERLKAERDAMKLQAQCWSHEAKAQRATVLEAYRVCTGNTGEPGDWNGAEPIRRLAARARAAEAALAGVKAQMSDEQIIRLCSAAKAQALREAAGRFDRAVNEVFGRNGVAQELDRLASEHERS